MRAQGTSATNRWSSLALLCVAQFIDVLGVTVVAVALPSIGRSLHLAGTGLQWVVSIYALFFGGFLMVCGRAADLYGRRRVFTLGLALFAIASLICGLATSATALVIARAAQGLGAAMVVPAALAMLTTIYPEGPAREKAIGIWTAVAAGGGVAGFFVGGVMTQTLGWRWVFILNLPVSIVALTLTRVLLVESRDTRAQRRLDLPGGITITAALLHLIYAFTGAGTVGFRSFITLGAAASAVILFLVFLVIERTANQPLVPLGIFRLRNVSGAALAAFTLTATTSAAGVVSTLYLQNVLGFTPTATGLVFAPFSIAVITGSFAGSWLSGRISERRTIMFGLLLIAVAMLCAHGISVSAGLIYLWAAFVIAGLGLGCASVAATSAGLARVSNNERGVVSALLNAAAQVGTALGIAALLALASARAASLSSGHVVTAEAAVAGYRLAYVAAAGIAGFGLLGTLILIRGFNGGNAAPPMLRTGAETTSHEPGESGLTPKREPGQRPDAKV